MQRSFLARLKSILADAFDLFLGSPHLIILVLLALAAGIWALKLYVGAHVARAGWGS